jgi:uncharacterized protein YeaO (DUF488 family)
VAAPQPRAGHGTERTLWPRSLVSRLVAWREITDGEGAAVCPCLTEAPSGADGRRVLVDRLWPGGLSQEAAQVDRWVRDVALSAELRKWFGHDPQRWPEFVERYFTELGRAPESWQPNHDRAGRGPVTLLYSAKDEEHNNAVALKRYLETARGQSGSRLAASSGVATDDEAPSRGCLGRSRLPSRSPIQQGALSLRNQSSGWPGPGRTPSQGLFDRMDWDDDGGTGPR